MFCRNCGKELPPNTPICQGCGVLAGQGRRYCPSCGTQTDELAVVCIRCGCPLQSTQQMQAGTGGNMPYVYGRKSRVAAGILGILLGSLGVHSFYLGHTNRGILQLVVTLAGGAITCGLSSAAMGIWGLVEGIQILSGIIRTDANGVELGD